MTFALWTILVAAVLPLLCTAAAKYGGSDGFDNHQPRVWETTLTGWRARANWAHRNHYEAFGPFAAAVLTAQWAHAPQPVVDGLAAAFIVARVGYSFAYVMDRAGLRSLLWTVGFVCVVLLFCAGLLRSLA